MKRCLLCIFALTWLLCGCGGDDDGTINDETGTIAYLKNDLAFAVGKWELVRQVPTYNADSWIDLKPDMSFSANVTYPAKPYSEDISGTYRYADGTIRCTDSDGKAERRFTFIQITGKDSYNKIKVLLPQSRNRQNGQSGF